MVIVSLYCICIWWCCLWNKENRDYWAPCRNKM